MHLLERRVRVRRQSDIGPGRDRAEVTGANRRINDRRVAARRRAMVMRRLQPMRLEGVEILKMEGATYVVNESCFAWLAEVRYGLSSRFVAGCGSFADTAVSQDESVTAGIRRCLQEWEEILRRR